MIGWMSGVWMECSKLYFLLCKLNRLCPSLIHGGWGRYEMVKYLPGPES